MTDMDKGWIDYLFFQMGAVSLGFDPGYRTYHLVRYFTRGSSRMKESQS